MIEYNDLIREKFYELQKNEISLKTFFDNQDFFKKIFLKVMKYNLKRKIFFEILNKEKTRITGKKSFFCFKIGDLFFRKKNGKII